MILITSLNKPYTIEQRVCFIEENQNKHSYTIIETENALEAWGYSDEELLEQAKQAKVNQNDTIRDEALLQGVIYKDVLFDSDTDQKINLLAIVSTMGDEDTITWFGMDNVPLECTKLDLINIGGLITALHSFCWNKNAEIKEAINEATTIEEVDAIVIDYLQEEEDEIIPIETPDESEND